MQADDLKTALVEIGLEKSDLARLLGVTLRAVNMWMAGDREVPGPAGAYLRLLRSLPPALQAQEIATLSKGDGIMYDGLFAVEYSGLTGRGAATPVFSNGVIFGHDGGVAYDGTYAPSRSVPEQMEIQLWLTVPPGVPLVQGVPGQPAEYRFAIRTSIPARGVANQTVQTPYGAVDYALRFLRTLPDALAA